MFIYGNIRTFIIKFSIGLLSIIFAGLLFFSFWENLNNLQNFKTLPLEFNFESLFVFYFVYLTNYIFIFLGIPSFLIPLFCLLYGVRILLGINTYYISLKFILLLIGILLTNFVVYLSKLFGNGIIGKMIIEILPDNIINFFENNLIKWAVVLIVTIIVIMIITTSFSIRLKYFNKINFIIFVLFKNLFTLLKFVKFLFPRNLFNKNIKEYKKTIIKKTIKKSEPTLKRQDRNNFSLKKKNTENEGYVTNILYEMPSINLLDLPKEVLKTNREIDKRNEEFSKKLEKILSEYGVEGQIVNFKHGPVVTLFEFLPAAGVKTSKVVSLSDDITRAMSSLSTRISSQPGKTSIGIEIPNTKRENVLLGELVNDNYFINQKGLILALGKNIAGEKIFADLEKMPHLLIAGTTGSGKSVGINSMIISLLLKFTPSECKLILIDPKMLELSVYEEIPHLLTPVVTNPNKAVFALKWVVREMENRYRLMSSLNVKNINSFNEKISKTISSGRKLYREVQTGIDKETRMPILEKKEIPLEKMPLIVVVIDEMADLMMVAGKEVENLVQRLAQMARASGIHLIAATQRPSVDVITGTIKANFPSRISFRVASRFDSRTILNEMGAEQLLGSGDMLFLENGANLTRLHGGFVSEREIENIVRHIKSQSFGEEKTDITIENENVANSMDLGFSNKDVDELYEKAVSIVLEQQKVSTSFVQRYLQIGYNRAARIVEKMEEDGYISEANNSGKRTVLKK